MPQFGKTTGNLKLRPDVGLEQEPLAFLVPDTELEILEESEHAYKVRVKEGGKEGYVGKKYVALTTATEAVAFAVPATPAPAAPAPAPKADVKPAPKGEEVEKEGKYKLGKDTAQ